MDPRSIHSPRGDPARHLAAVAAAAAVACAGLLPLAGPVAASIPDNDNLANPTAITTLPFDAYPDMSQATLETGEAIGCDNGYGLDQSVWYSWTASEAGQLNVQVDGSWGGQTAAVYGPFTTLPTDVTTIGSPSACVFYPGPDSALHEQVASSGMYLFQLTTISSWGVSPHLGISEDIPPANDNVANAEIVAGLPFSADTDLSLASLETGEMDVCGIGLARSVWYRFTPSADTTMAMSVTRDFGISSVTIYPQGSTGIGPLATGGQQCTYSNPIRLTLSGGTTYLIQVGDAGYGSEPVHFVLQPGPAPMSASVAINPNGTVDRAGGVAHVSISVTCNNAADFSVYAVLRERLTRTSLASASAYGGGRCGPTPTVLSIAFAADSLAFAPGSAQLSVHVDAYDGWSSTFVDISGTVKLRYAK